MRYYPIVAAFMFLFLDAAFVQAQDEAYPAVGQPCPDVTLHNIRYYDKQAATIKDFHGKWLILDFWNKHCGACVASFPSESKLQEKLGDKLQVMMVGIQDKEGQIEPMYARFRQKEHLVMPCSFDSALANKWDIYAAPYTILIDPDGVVKAITVLINEKDMQEFLKGVTPRLPKVTRMHEDEVDDRIPFDKTRPFLVGNNGGADSEFVFRSLLSKFDFYKQHYQFPYSISADSAHGRFQVLGASVERLYNYAYYGRLNPDEGNNYQAILQVRDSSVFKFSSKYSRNLFCYSLSLPPAMANKAHLQESMKKDLMSWFGFHAGIEEREFPCWKLKAREDVAKRLKTKGGAKKFEDVIPHANFKLTNYPFDEFVGILRGSHSEIIDETGIKENIDIDMNCILDDINDLDTALKKYGLYLEPAQRLKKALVISD